MSYIDGYLVPVPTDRKDAYKAMAELAAPIFREYGATRVVEAWGDDLPDGKLTDFKRAVALKDGETVAVGWITWPDKAVRDAGWEKLMQDDRMMGGEAPPFDAQRMIYAGFEVVAEN